MFIFLVCLSLIYFAALQIHCSAQCKDLLEALGGYTLQERGLVPMKVGYILKSGIISVRLVHRSVWDHFYAKCEISKKNVVADKVNPVHLGNECDGNIVL